MNCREQQDKRFEQERSVLVRNYENDLGSMVEQQRKQVESLCHFFYFSRRVGKDFIIRSKE